MGSIRTATRIFEPLWRGQAAVVLQGRGRRGGRRGQKGTEGRRRGGPHLSGRRCLLSRGDHANGGRGRVREAHCLPPPPGVQGLQISSCLLAAAPAQRRETETASQ